jgi:hypothetical protein
MTIPGSIFDSVANLVRTVINGFGLRMYGSSSGYVGLKPAANAGSTDFTLPSADGTNGQALTTNGSGTLAFASVGNQSLQNLGVLAGY